MTKRPVVLITDPIAEVAITLLAQGCDIRAPWVLKQTWSLADLEAADAIIVGLVRVDAQLLSAAPKLKVIGRHGVGLDNIDLRAATARNLPVVFVPGVNANAVAEHTVTLMLALVRATLASHQAVLESNFQRRTCFVSVELRDQVLGIVGLGAVGTRVAQICRRGFEMEVIGYDPYVKASRTPAKLVNCLEDLLEEADIVSLHLPLTPATHHLLDARKINSMKPSACLINTARGAIIDTIALAEALRRGHLMGAALDVFEEEPLPPSHPLLTAPRTLFTPHIASSTHRAREEMGRTIARQVLAVLHGERPEFLANPEVYESK